jgi:hypothetical protein
MRSHMGISFTIWNRRQTWFWLILNQHGNGGTIGTAVSEAEAVRDASSSIEEMSGRPPSPSASLGSRDVNALVPTSRRAYPCSGAQGWMDWWMTVAHQVTDRMLTEWADLVLRSS